MFGCYRKQDANDPDVYVAAIASILDEYPPSVIDFITDPRTGLPNRLKWLPTVAEVREACETQLGIAKNVIAVSLMAQEKRAILADPRATDNQKSLASDWLDRVEASPLLRSATNMPALTGPSTI